MLKDEMRIDSSIYGFPQFAFGNSRFRLQKSVCLGGELMALSAVPARLGTTAL